MKNLNVPVVFPGLFPPEFINDLNGWSFSQEELNKNKGKILTLDIDLGDYCSLSCPQCFRRSIALDQVKRKMTFNETMEVVLKAKKLGLRSVKFLGSGEPLENNRFIDFLRFLKDINVIPIVFTKGHVIGDDSLTKRYHHFHGINNGVQLVKELYDLDASIVFGFNSFNSKIQEDMVGGMPGYTTKRDLALKRLIDAGFNSTNPTRLAFGVTPITPQNYNEIFSIYQWARERNIYVLTAPTMVGGKAYDWERITPSQEELIDLYAKIYKFNMEKRIQTIDQIKREGISAYAGSHPCNQVACGMYITLSGKVLRCPGDDVTILGNIFENSLEEIWVKSENFRRAGTFNCKCPPKMGKSFSMCFFERVMEKILC